MKWIYMIVVLIVAGTLVYYLFIGKQSAPGTPTATAEAFVNAVLKDDIDRAKGFCNQSALSDADRVMERIKAINPDRLGITYKNMSAKPPYRGVMVTFRGNMIPMQLLKEGEIWKIANMSMD